MENRLEENYTVYIDFLKNNLSPYRYKHSLMSARIAREISKILNLHPNQQEKIVTAALLHDITKEKEADFHKSIFRKNNLEHLLDTPQPLWHAYSAPYFIKTLWNIDDAETGNAIYYHTTGKPDMDTIEKIVFVSDFLSSSIKNQEFPLDESLDIDILCLEKLTNTLTTLIQEKKVIQHDSINFYNQLIKK